MNSSIHGCGVGRGPGAEDARVGGLRSFDEDSIRVAQHQGHDAFVGAFEAGGIDLVDLVEAARDPVLTVQTLEQITCPVRKVRRAAVPDLMIEEIDVALSAEDIPWAATEECWWIVARRHAAPGIVAAGYILCWSVFDRFDILQGNLDRHPVNRHRDTEIMMWNIVRQRRLDVVQQVDVPEIDRRAGAVADDDRPKIAAVIAQDSLRQ